MNKLLAGMQQVPTARTANGDGAHATTWNSNLDLFGAIGSLRKDQNRVTSLFDRAYAEDFDLAVRIALWARDVRGGAGERQSFRTILRKLANMRPDIAEKLIPMVPEVGRWDDLLQLLDTKVKDAAITEIAKGLHAGNGLCAKWMPRKGKEAVQLCKAFGMQPKQYRKLLVSMTNVVETAMCAKNWDSIDFGKIPSLAAARYQKAFGRNAPTAYANYVAALEKGEAKINAAAIFPHDVLMSANKGNDSVASQQWKALPNYMEGSGERVLAMVDVSGSMASGINREHKSGGVTCMDVSVALGIYCAERNEGPFKDHFITFTSTPRLVKVTGNSLRAKAQEAKRHVGYDTNFDAAYNLILDTAVRNKVPQEEMPTMLLILSDMQFNQGYSYVHTTTAHQRLTAKFKAAGYEIPKMVYWNLNATYGNSPITMHDTGACLVSGFSPSILTAVMAAKAFNPYEVMLAAVNQERYNWNK